MSTLTQLILGTKLKLARPAITALRLVDQERVALVIANIKGRDLGSVSEDIQKVIDRLEVPPDFRVSIGGQQREMVTSLITIKEIDNNKVFYHF